MSEHVTRKLDVVAFHCSKCGACCNSAPQLSLPELFHHQHRFVGCLTVRRVERLRPGARWGASEGATEAECEAFEAFVPAYLHAATGPRGAEFVWLAAQAYDEPGRGSCPALAHDKLCTLELDHKPLGCRSVPLEAMMPDLLQVKVLAQRGAEAAYMGANCIDLAPRPDAPPFVSGPTVTDAGARRALAERRLALALDRRFWGDDVFQILRPELFDHPERVGNLPSMGYLSLSLAPALAVVASASKQTRERVVEFLSAQLELLAELLGTGGQSASPTGRTLAGFVRANVALRTRLQQVGGAQPESPRARELEAWLDLGAAPSEAPRVTVEGAAP